jgi:hypothetical protein
MRRLVPVLLLATTTVLPGAAGAAEKSSARNAAVAAPDPQIAAGYERLRASLGRLKTVARAAEKQPESPQAIADLNRAILGGESSYEFLIGMFSSLNAKDHEKQLAMLSETLAFLRTQKQILAAKLAAKVNEAARKESAQALAAFSDRALAAAVVPPSRFFAPTPAR